MKLIQLKQSNFGRIHQKRMEYIAGKKRLKWGHKGALNPDFEMRWFYDSLKAKITYDMVMELTKNMNWKEKKPESEQIIKKNK